MLVDGISIGIIVKELRKGLIDAMIDKIYQLDKVTIVMVLRKPGKQMNLLISADSGNSRIYLTERPGDNRKKPPSFCMLLRKHLQRSRIIDITQHENDRIVLIKIKGVNERGEREEKVVAAEIMGRYSNIILYRQKDRTIIDSIIHVPSEVSRVRQVKPGLKYQYPPRQNKIDPYEIDNQRLYQVLSTGFGTTKVCNILLKNIAGLGPYMAREVMAYSGLDPEITYDSVNMKDDKAIKQIQNGYFEIIDSLRGYEYEPCVVYKENEEKPQAVLPIKSRRYYIVKDFKSFTMACDEYYTKKLEIENLAIEKRKLHDLVKRATNRLASTENSLVESLAKCEKADEYRKTGDILAANLSGIKNGQKVVELVDIYSHDGSVITIQLDETMSPSQNMNEYFKKYKKAKAGKEKVLRQLKKVKSELDYLDSIETSVKQCESSEELEDIKYELEEEGYIEKKQKKQTRRTLKQPWKININGYDVYIGKNNRQNDLITMNMANPEDIWLHVKDYPGSHVLIRTNNQRDIDQNVIRKAAQIGAFYSKARNSENVPVDYTQIKYVTKPKKSKPGKVIYRNYNTIYVNPTKNT